MPAITVSPVIDADALNDSEKLAGTDFQILLDALNARDNLDAQCCRQAREGSALQKHHSMRLKASSRLAEKRCAWPAPRVQLDAGTTCVSSLPLFSRLQEARRPSW